MWRQGAAEHPRPDTPIHVAAQKANPFYEEWWFLVVIALVGLIFILLLVFVLIIRGQSKKYAKKTDSGELAPRPAARRVCLPRGKVGAGGSLSPGRAPALLGRAAWAPTHNLLLLFGLTCDKRERAARPGGVGEASGLKG